MSTDWPSVDRMSGSVPQLFPSLGPALVISMGYIDLGKWAAAVEGGARFGFDLVLLVLFFSCSAIFCQYLTTCIGVVTGKNLAQICNEEYCRPACILLGFQAEISMITSDITSILGIAQGLNILLGVDILACILLSAIISVLLPFFISHLDNHKAEVMYISVAGFALLFYVLGVLISQPEIPLAMNGIFPRLSGESAYSLMALLGSNIMAHNFYTHSSIVQLQRRAPNVAVGALCHDHFFAILFIFSGIFLVNYVLMNSAASVFDTAGLMLTFQDVFLLMDQVLWTPIAPFAFFLVLLFSSLVTASTWNLGGQSVSHYLFGIDLSASAHHVLMKALAIIPALYCAQSASAEGIYQLLIFCQVILAMILLSSVIPLFRVASSTLIMGAFKISWYLEILALLAFFGMLASNIIFIIEMLFGNSSWIVNLRGNTGSSLTFPFIVLLSIACISLCLTLYLAVTPLKSASDRSDIQMWTWDFQKDSSHFTEGIHENDLKKIGHDEDQESATEPVEPVLEKSSECQSENSTLEFNLDLPEMATHSRHGSQQPTLGINLTRVSTSVSNVEESKSEVESGRLEIADNISAVSLFDGGVLERVESNEPVRNLQRVADGKTEKDEEEGDVCEPEPSSGILSSSTSEGTDSSKNMSKGEDLGSGNGSLSRLSGLGRATRRQFSAILDEFWGHLFDFHGQLTQEAITRRVDVLLGLDLKTNSSSLKADTAGNEFCKKNLPEAVRGLAFPMNSRDYSSPNQQKIPNKELSYGFQMGSPFWSSNTQLFSTLEQSSWRNLPESGERQYSSLHLPQYSYGRDYQPATIQGYQMPSYLRGLGVGRYSDPSSISLDAPPAPKYTESFVPNYRDPLTYTLEQNRLGSLPIPGFQNPAVSRANKLQVERSHYEPSLVGTSDSVLSSTYTKKYHSLPDISGLTVSIRNSSLNDRNFQCGGPIGPRASVGRTTPEQSPYSHPVSQTEGGPLSFDELSPSKLYRDVFSLETSSNPDTKSLWARQPFEQLFGMDSQNQNQEDKVANKVGLAPMDTFSCEESETKFLRSLKFCIVKLLKLEGSDWLFRQNGGADEELIDQVAVKERFLYEADASEVNQIHLSDPRYLCSDRKPSLVQRNDDVDLANFFPLLNCGDSCIWRAGLIVSFGVWCIRRILELSLVESRPELWGKYTYVLNRLQGILEPAFSKQRSPASPCPCLDIPAAHRKMSNGLPQVMGKTFRGRYTSAVMVLEIIKDVETAISVRKGRMGTAAGDVAFPKGKENLASVLKRYKRRLTNKSSGTHDGGSSSRKVPLPATSVL